MSSERTPKSAQREAPPVTRLSTRRGKPSEHVVRKCCACLASPSSSRGDQRTPHRPSGAGTSSSSKHTVKKKTGLKTSDHQDGDSATKSKRSGLAGLRRLSKERDAVKLEQDDCRNKPGTSGKDSDIAAQRKSRVAEVETSRKKSIESQRVRPATGTRAKTAGASTHQRLQRTKLQLNDSNNVHKTPTPNSGSSPAQAGLLSKQAPKRACSSLTMMSRLKKPPVPKSSPRKEPEGQSSQGRVLSQGKKKVQCEVKRQPTTASKSQTKLPSNSDSDSDSEASGSDCSSDESSDNEPHITMMDGSDHKIGKNCGFCEGDLGVASWEEDEHEAEFSKLPVVSILCCGHAFHSYCLDSAGLEGKEGDPACVLCESVNIY